MPEISGTVTCAKGLRFISNFWPRSFQQPGATLAQWSGQGHRKLHLGKSRLCHFKKLKCATYLGLMVIMPQRFPIFFCSVQQFCRIISHTRRISRNYFWIIFSILLVFS